MASNSAAGGGLLERFRGVVGTIVPVDLAADPAFDVVDRLKHIHEGPLRNIRHAIWWVRKTFFTRQRSENPAFLVDMEKPEVIQVFGSHYFEPGWELSYNYLGEVLNIRRVEYREETEYDWWQVHIRGYHHDDGGIELSAHYETEPTEHPDAHISLKGLTIQYGMETVRGILDEEGIDYEHLDPEETDAEQPGTSSGPTPTD